MRLFFWMNVVKTISETRKAVACFKREGKLVGFVPTMGALHKGHLSLIRLARQHADEVVVSIYVNPEQFGPNEDFEEYPRTLERDLEVCREEGVSLVFTPDDEIMYGDKKFLSIHIDTLADYMDGKSRPGFFEGILLVVNKLFNIVRPDIAVFGQKDIQQFQIISRMVKEFNHPVQLVMGPIVRANDGLAMSSRNAYLSDEERLMAPSLYRALKYIENQINAGVHEPGLLIEHQKDELQAKGLEIDYLNVFSMNTIQPVESLAAGKRYILAGAAYAGHTRLIDNLLIDL